MGKSSKRRPWGSARHEFSAIKDDVCRRIGDGEPLVAVYRDLAPPMEYRTFCRHAARAVETYTAKNQSLAVDSDRDSGKHNVIQSESPPSDADDPISAAIRAKAAPGTFDRLKRQPAYNPRENTIEELFGVDEHGNSVGEP